MLFVKKRSHSGSLDNDSMMTDDDDDDDDEINTGYRTRSSRRTTQVRERCGVELAT